MATSDALRAYAAHLFAMALIEREKGNPHFAERLTVRASEYLDKADAQEAAEQQAKPDPDKRE